MKRNLRGKVQWSIAFWLLRFDDISWHSIFPKTQKLEQRLSQETNLHLPSQLSRQEKVWPGQTNQSGLAPSICFGIMILSLWLPARSIRRSKRRGLKEELTFPSGKERRRKLTAALRLHRIFPYGFVAAAALVLSNGHTGPFVTPAHGECNDSIKPQSVVVSASGGCIDRAPVGKRRAKKGKGKEGGVWASSVQRWVDVHTHAHTRLNTIFSLIYSRFSAHVLLASATAAVSWWFSPSVNEGAG